MQTTSDVLFRKLCYLLHRSFVEMRKLAQLKLHEQVFDLADTFEQLPGFLSDWTEENMQVLRSNLQAYQDKHQGRACDYLSVLDMDDGDFMDVLAQW